MDALLRSLAVYAFLLVVFRATGKRTLAQITMFDFVLLLIVSEATQQALLGDDFSVVNGCLVVLTLLMADRGLDVLTHRSPHLDRWLNDAPLVLIDDGRVLHDRLDRARVGADDILEQARQTQGLERLEQIRYAVLERNGAVSVIPYGEGTSTAS
jgi:uncharacterized membrane protein YcaP (DUF421 family)